MKNKMNVTIGRRKRKPIEKVEPFQKERGINEEIIEKEDVELKASKILKELELIRIGYIYLYRAFLRLISLIY